MIINFLIIIQVVLMNSRENIKLKGIYLLFFTLVFCAFYNIPLVHDSWAGQVYNQSNNFVTWIFSRIAGYFSLNGRIIAQIFVGFFERNKLMLNVANAFFMTCLVYFIQKVINKKDNLFITLLIMLSLLLVSTNLRVEVYFYATMIYVIPVLLFFVFLWYTQIYQEKTWGTDKIRFWILCVLGILNSGWIEHSGFAFVFIIGVCWLKNVLETKKINFRYTVFEVINGVTFLTMILSPGLKRQRQFSVEVENTWRLFASNIAKIVQAVVFDHLFLMLMIIFTCYFVVRQRAKKSLLKNIYQWTMIVYSILFFINWLGSNIGIELPLYLKLNCLQENIWGAISCCFGFGLIVLLFIALMCSKDRSKLCFVYWVGAFSLLPIIITPNFGYRICFFSVILIMYLFIDLFCSIDIDKRIIQIIIKSIVIFALLVQVDMYAILISNISSIQTERENRIELVKNMQRLGTWNYDHTLILPTFSFTQLYMGASPEPYYDYIHYKAFLDYYELDEKTLVEFSDLSDELRVKVKDDNVCFEILLNNVSNETNSYIYYIMKDGQIMWSSGQIQDACIVAKCPNDEGNYYFKCDVIDEHGGLREVYSARTISKN